MSDLTDAYNKSLKESLTVLEEYTVALANGAEVSVDQVNEVINELNQLADDWSKHINEFEGTREYQVALMKLADKLYDKEEAA